jgi:anti-anti-sigma factor
MGTALGWTVDESADRTVVAVRGRLDLAGSPGLRTALLKCLAEQPDGLLIDLSAVETVDATAFTLFTSVARQAARWPGTPLLICAPSPAVATLLDRGGHSTLIVHVSVADGIRALAAGLVIVPVIRDELLPIAGAARHGRAMATEACLAWGLPDLVGPASLIVSELISNAVQHAGTMMTLRLSRRARHLHIAVRDGSTAEPARAHGRAINERGRGLMLVESEATHWGWLPTKDGKVVWATLAA